MKESNRRDSKKTEPKGTNATHLLLGRVWLAPGGGIHGRVRTSGLGARTTDGVVTGGRVALRRSNTQPLVECFL